jgi:ketosteroid isomerase-like protein
MAQVKGAGAFVELNRQFLPAMRGSRMLRQFEKGDEVCSIYELGLVRPSGSQFSAHMADWIKVRDGRMAVQRLYYDAREFEKQMGGATSEASYGI